MNERLNKHLEAAKALQIQLRAASDGSDFARSLTVSSLDSHVDELNSFLVAEEYRPVIELVDFRIDAPGLEQGAMPLGLLAKATNEIRKMIGHAALRLSEGGLRKQRVPNELYSFLNLRLVGILPGSSRLVVAADAHRDLFDDGIAKQALERIFAVLHSGGEGQEFLEAISDLGVASTRQLRNFLHLLRDNGAELDLLWKYSGLPVGTWNGTKEAISAVTTALDLAELTETDDALLEGVIELLSKRERISLRLPSGEGVRILYPRRLLPQVSELHLDQRVALMCRVMQTANPNTGESTTTYELLEIQKI
jgi:hypothetical protein